MAVGQSYPSNALRENRSRHPFWQTVYNVCPSDIEVGVPQSTTGFASVAPLPADDTQYMLRSSVQQIGRYGIGSDDFCESLALPS